MGVNVIVQLPEFYPVMGSAHNGRRIIKRTPYIIQADLIVPASTSNREFAQGSFEHANDYPFEVLRMIPRVTSLDSSSLPQLDDIAGIGDLRRFVQISMKLVGAQRDMTKFNTRLSAIMPKDSDVYDFYAPLYCEKGQGFQVAVSNAVTSANAAGGIRMEIGFVGNTLEFEG